MKRWADQPLGLVTENARDTYEKATTKVVVLDFIPSKKTLPNMSAYIGRTAAEARAEVSHYISSQIS